MIGFIVVGAIVGVSLIIRGFISRYTRKYKKLKPSSELVGLEFVERVMEAENIDVKLEKAEGDGEGEFLFRKETVRVPGLENSSLLGLAISAHELAHAKQVESRRFLMVATAFFERFGVLISYVFPFTLIIGFIFYSPLLTVALMLYFLILFVLLVKLPLEVDANRKALSYLDNYGELTKVELGRLKKFLLLAILTRLTDLTAGFLVLLNLNEKR